MSSSTVASSGTKSTRRPLLVLNIAGATDLVLTDVVMPGTSGPELARRVRSTRSNLPIICISGHADPDRQAGRLVHTPFRAAELLEEIEDAVDRARAALVV